MNSSTTPFSTTVKMACLACASIATLLFTGCQLPGSHSHPTILGETGRQLTATDIADVERIVKDCGERAWLLDGPPSQVSAVSHLVVAYCSPRVSTRELRRGFLVSAHRELQSPTNTWGPWSLGGKDNEYAQVKIPGKNFDHIESDQDPNRPFRVRGQFTDSELVNLVVFLRSPEAGRRGIQAATRIGTVSREADGSVRVEYKKTEWSGQTVFLRQQGKAWVIVSVGSWMA